MARIFPPHQHLRSIRGIVSALALLFGLFLMPPCASAQDTVINLLYLDDLAKLPTLTYSEIEVTEYRALASKHRIKSVVDSSIISFQDTTFSLVSGNETRLFNLENMTAFAKRQRYSWHEYRGYFPKLNLVILEGWSNGEFTLCWGSYLDVATNTQYSLWVNADGCSEPPIVSPNYKFLVTYTSGDSGDDRSFIGVLQIKEKGNGHTYHNWASATLEEGLVQELIWISDTAFIVRKKDRVFNEKTRNYDTTNHYLKVRVPTS